MSEDAHCCHVLDFTMTRNTALWLVDNEEEIGNKGYKMMPYILVENFMSTS